MTDPADLTMAEAGMALRSGEMSAVDLLESVLIRATFTEPHLHAFLTIDSEGARAAAIMADAAFASGEDAGPLQGIPIALKDNICTRGVSTTAASQFLEGYMPPYDATVVERLRSGGAVIVGKTNLDEFGMGSSTENSAYGPTRNPWDTDRVPGGSSGGSAAAVAVGTALAALGSDTGGSIRQPAALTGVVGMKPTYGLVSRYGLIAFASSFDQIGPLTRSVADSAALFSVIAGFDPRDATTCRGDTSVSTAQLASGVSGLRIGLVKELSSDGIDPDITAAVRRTVDHLANSGAEVSEVSLPTLTYSLPAYYLVAPAECSANLARFDGVRYGLRVNGETATEMMSRTRASGFGPEVIRRVLLGTYALSAGYYDAFYGKAQRVRTLIRRDFAEAYESFDALVSPTSPTTAFAIGERTTDPLAMYSSDICTLPSNLSGDPGISVPVGLDGLGLPIGFQIMAPALYEGVLFRVAAEVERQAQFTSRPALAVSDSLVHTRQ